MITVQVLKKFPDRTFGLGQDVSTNLVDIVKVPALFVPNSIIHQDLINGRLKRVTVNAGAPQKVYDTLYAALQSTEISNSNLITLPNKGRTPYASGLIRAIFDGQKGSVAIKNWPAQNYLAVAIGLGLVDLDYDKDLYYITDLGKQAVDLLDNKEIKKLQDFLLKRLYEYPYAAWLIRLVNKDKSKQYTKFNLGENFGFIDEPGFTSLPEDLYVDAMLNAKVDGDKSAETQIRSNYESTADKYMRWLAGVLVNYGLLDVVQKEFSRKENGKKYSISLRAYKVTLKGTRALNKVNGGSRFPRSVKRVRWEYLAPKVKSASKRKTSRALMLKYLSESSKGLSANKISQKINAVSPSIGSIPEQVLDDAIGLNRLGIEIEINGNHLTLKEKLTAFIIPVKENHTFQTTEADNLKRKLLPVLKHVDHKYLQAIDIAYKKNTSNAENTLLEVLSTDLFVKEMDYKGSHLGGSNKPDAFVYTSKAGWILDSKAYSDGFHVTAANTDAMGRYIQQYRDHKDKSTWWKKFPNNLPITYFAYISSFYNGNYQSQLKDFEDRNKMRGGLIEIPKLILLAEEYQDKKISHAQINQQLLDDKIDWKDYSTILLP